MTPKKPYMYKVLVWIEDNGLAHAIRTDNEEFNSLNEDEKHWAYNIKETGERTVRNVMKMLVDRGNHNYKVVTFPKRHEDCSQCHGED